MGWTKDARIACGITFKEACHVAHKLIREHSDKKWFVSASAVWAKPAVEHSVTVRIGEPTNELRSGYIYLQGGRKVFVDVEFIEEL